MQQNDLRSAWYPHSFPGDMHQTALQRLRVLQRHLAAAAGGAPRPRVPVLSSLADRSSLIYGAAAVAMLGVLATGKCILAACTHQFLVSTR
jgi:hypothetical protein